MPFHQLSEANRDSINLNNLNISVKLHSDIIYTGDILKGVVLLRVREAIFIEGNMDF